MTDLLLRGASISAIALAWGMGTPVLAQDAAARTADIVLTGGNILTVDDDFSSVSAVAISDGRFVAVGSDEEVSALVGPDTRNIDLGGRTVVPGLIDNHLHQLSAALNAPLVSFLDARSIADVQEAVAARVAETAPGEWIQASSAWHESTLAEGRLPTRHDLDAVSPDNPVYVPRGGHVVTVNSAALAAAGITRDTPNPEGGIIVRDEQGEPTGVLLESATYLVREVLPPGAPPEDQARLLTDFMKELNAYGVVGVVEPGLSAEQIELYDQLRQQGELTVRTSLLYRIRGLEDAQTFVDSYDRDFSDDMLSIDGVKFLLDGGVEGAYLNEPYEIVEGEQTDPEFRGVLLLPPGGQEELVEAYKVIAEDGWQVQTHAVGDATIDAALDAYEAVNATTPISDLRWALMHVFLPSADAMERMKEMQVLATVQDHALLLGHNQLRYWGEERAAYAIPIRSLLDAGVETSGGTDAPVLPASPFLSISWMTTRELMNGSVLGPEQAITREEALRLWTIESAYLVGTEEDRGSIEVGKLADLAVLSGDLMSVSDEELKSLTAELTMLGGEVVHGSLEQ
ncbi:amidohydrolase [Paracoccus sp. S-4012]|uniref:amidohydrolase n=1 Tax=Paracoccus sp. S-4012 TaxID=2665648 RepID=UPI0018A22DCB|nr:amidohydrolase [Paracoccus sp. S-4012]